MPDQETAPAAALPPDDLNRQLALAQAEGSNAIHLGIVGDTYTLLITGEQTDDRFCLIDMYVPKGGGPGPHRHDFDETFVLLEGELEVTFRGEKRKVAVGDVVNIPANAPHAFHNLAETPARMYCICAPAGNERFFQAIGKQVPTRTSTPPKPSPEELRAFQQKAEALAPQYKTELLPEA